MALNDTRGKVLVQYIGDCSFFSVSHGKGNIGFKPRVPVEIDHEVLEMIMEAQPGKIQILGVISKVKEPEKKPVEDDFFSGNKGKKK